MRLKRHAAPLAAILPGCPRGCSTRDMRGPAWPFNPYDEARFQEQMMWSQWRDWLVWNCIRTGAILGGFLCAWLGFRLYGLNGAIGGTLIGMVLGSVLGVVVLVFSLIALLVGAFYGLLWVLILSN